MARVVVISPQRETVLLGVTWIAAQALGAGSVGGDAARFDLRDLPESERCVSGGSGEIVVCAARDRSLRLGALPEGDFEPKPLRAELQMGTAKGALAIETKEFPGAVSQRLMVKLKMPF